MTYALIGGLVGIVCGKPPWRQDTFWTSALKGIGGLMVGALLYWGGSKLLGGIHLSLPASAGGAARSLLAELPIILGPAGGRAVGGLHRGRRRLGSAKQPRGGRANRRSHPPRANRRLGSMLAAVFPDGPLFPRLGGAAHEPSDPWFVVAPRLDEAAAGKFARREIFGRVLAPADIRQARATALDRIRLIQVPFWRVELSIDAYDVIADYELLMADKPLTFFRLPAYYSREGCALMVSARDAFPYQPKVPDGSTARFFGTPALQIAAWDMRPAAAAPEHPPAEGEVLECDVPREMAEQTAEHALVNKAIGPLHALAGNYKVHRRAVRLVYYPIYYLRYRYDGEARQHGAESFAVAVSACTGNVVGAKHPSALRAISGKSPAAVLVAGGLSFRPGAVVRRRARAAPLRRAGASEAAAAWPAPASPGGARRTGASSAASSRRGPGRCRR